MTCEINDDTFYKMLDSLCSDYEGDLSDVVNLHILPYMDKEELEHLEKHIQITKKC